MTPPYTQQPGYQQQPPPGNDRTQLYGILGLVIGLLCCSPIGIVLGVLSMNEAKKAGKPNTLGLVATIVSAVMLVLGPIVYAVTRS